MLKVQQAAPCRENVPCGRKKGQMEKTVAKAKSVPDPIPRALPLDAPLEGGKALTKSLLGLERQRIWFWAVHLQDHPP